MVDLQDRIFSFAKARNQLCYQIWAAPGDFNLCVFKPELTQLEVQARTLNLSAYH